MHSVRAAAGALALLAAVLVPLVPSVARAGDDAGPAPASAAPSPRQAAVEAEIRSLERSLSALRKVRTELAAGRAEPVPADDAARRVREVDVRALREVARYESSRTKAVAALGDAAAADEAKRVDLRAAIESVDRKFGESMARLEEERDGAKAADKEKAASTPPSPRRRPSKSSADAGDDEPDDRD